MDPRMGAFDAVMYDVEDDPILRSVIVMLTELDARPDAGRLQYRIDRLTRLVPKLRQRVVGNPLSLVPPRWETDPNFELGYHVREELLPPDGNDHNSLMLRVAGWAERDFDQARPLWEIILFTGLQRGAAAVAIKLHHSITDGVGGLQLAAAMLDLTADADDPADMPEGPDGGAADWSDRLEQGAAFSARSLLSDGVGATRKLLAGARATVADPLGSLLTGQEFVASATRVLAPASTPLSPVMTGRSLSVRFTDLSIPFAGLKAAGKAAGGTVNDAFVAAALGGMLAYHEEHGEVPPELRVHMPVNRRAPGDTGGGNRWIPARFPLPLNESDAGRRIRQLSPLLKQAKEEPALAVSDQVYKVLMSLPRPITTRIAGGLMKGTDLVVTNVPGPPFEVYLAGAKVTRMIPLAPKGGAAVNIAFLTYNGNAEIGINIDTEAVPDPDEMTACLQAGFDEVVASAE